MAALQVTTRQYDKAATALEAARKISAGAVLAALKDGVPPTTVAELSPFTATYVRQKAREAGIPAATTRRSPKRRGAAS